MSPFAVQLLRRVASLAAVGALLVVALPLALTWAGLLGASPQEDIAGAERALEAARAYGAGPEQASYKAGAEELARARSLLAGGEAREARRAAARARALGIEAQRVALGTRESSRRRAQAAADEIDGLLNELEALFDQNTRGLAPAEQSRLFSLMKEARQAGGGLMLAFNQGQFERVLEQEAACRQVLEDTRRQLLQAGKPRPPS
jgi:hypothetical protein